MGPARVPFGPKKVAYRAIKTTGTLIVIIAFDESCEAYVLCHTDTIQKKNFFAVIFKYIICGRL
jgi:hypothetical protein